MLNPKDLKSLICIYHSPCMDGTASMEVVKMYARENNVSVLTHGTTKGRDPISLNAVKDKDVVIVDFTYTREQTERIKEVARSLVIIDHHSTAYDVLGDLDYAIFDMEAAACRLVYEFFYPRSKKLPKILAHVEDKDLRRMELPNTRKIVEGLKHSVPCSETWHALMGDDTKVGKLVESGSVIVKYQNKQILDIVKRRPYNWIKVLGHLVPVINITDSNILTETLLRVGSASPFAVGYTNNVSGITAVSLRSREDGINVNYVAELFGGGGHPHAAGFSFPTQYQLDKVLTRVSPTEKSLSEIVKYEGVSMTYLEKITIFTSEELVSIGDLEDINNLSEKENNILNKFLGLRGLKVPANGEDGYFPGLGIKVFPTEL